MKQKISRTLIAVIAINTLFMTSDALAELSVRERCEQVLKMMRVETQGTERGWASLCAGIIHNEPITRYGNWYGPGYWGGDTNPDKAGSKPPLDSLDEIAMRHDFGYVIAEKYGKIYGKKYEFHLKAMADMVAVRDSMKLSEDPAKWDKVPTDIEKASRYRDRIVTGFIMESDLYKYLSTATKVGDTVTSPFITWFDEIDYTQIPDLDKFEREVGSHINGWKKEQDKKAAEEKNQQTPPKAEKTEPDKKEQQVADEQANESKSKEVPEETEATADKEKSYADMTPEERREALKRNDDAAWEALKAELTGEADNEEEKESETPPEGTQDSTSDIPPVKLTASGSFDEDYSEGGIGNIVTTTMTLSFWNVGSQVSGYGGATMHSKSVSSLNGSSSESSCSGSFSGGPHGVIKLGGECAGMTLGIDGGSTINMDEVSLKISDPSAFSYWDK